MLLPFAVVAITQDRPELGLRRGQVGCIVHQYSSEAFEVDFSNSDGESYATAAFKASELLELHYQPDFEAA